MPVSRVGILTILVCALVYSQRGYGATTAAAPPTNPPKFSPEAFGAKCDGVADDGPALARAAVAAAKAHAQLVIDCRLSLTSGTATIQTPVRFDEGGELEIRQGASVGFTDAFAAPSSRVFHVSGGRLTFEARVPQILVV